jgi:hypothetical protein
VTVKNAIFWDATYNLVKIHLHVRGTHCLHSDANNQQVACCFLLGLLFDPGSSVLVQNTSDILEDRTLQAGIEL